MENYIVLADLNVLNLLVGKVEFKPGLNIISGENGTLKTRMLQQIRGQHNTLTFSNPGMGVRMQAISPKRNAESKAFRAVYENFRQQNKKIESVINERDLNDKTFSDYPSLGELFYVVYENLCRDGGNQQDKMQETTDQFNGVIRKLFLDHKLVSTWEESTGTPNIALSKKKDTMVIPLEDLSLGEQEMLSLVVNLFASKERYDIFLIDEPEVHLNWHLEDKLFSYLDGFCTEFGKQIITVTHSRAIFKPKFQKKSQFLYWGTDGRIHCSRELTSPQRRKLAGEAIEIIRMGNFIRPTFFVEDGRHESIVNSIAKALGTEVSISECGNSANVKSLFQHAKQMGGWENSYFLIDGDNQGSPFPGEKQVIHLDRYCLENYLLDIDTASSLSGKTSDEVKKAILESIQKNSVKILNKNKFFAFLFDLIEIEHMTAERLALIDASEFISTFAKKIGTHSFSEYLQRYVTACHEQESLENIFPKKLIDAIKGI